MKGTSYLKLSSDPRNVAKGFINQNNSDNEFFITWCHISHLNRQDKDPQKIKISKLQYIEKLNYQGVKFPVTIKISMI